MRTEISKRIIRYLQRQVKLQAKQVTIIDNTCPRVQRVHELVRSASNRGMDIIIVGNANHPEVVGTIGWITTDVIVIKSIEEATHIIPQRTFSQNGVCMVAQTTYNKERYEEIYRYCLQFITNIEVHYTICDATLERQNEIRLLSQNADGVIIIGGKTSSNVNKLFTIASERCNYVQLIERSDEIDYTKIISLKKVIVASGASTPDWIIEEVINKLEEKCDEAKTDFSLTRL